MQAICIIAHKDAKQIMNLADILSGRFLLYIHFDKKLALSKTDVRMLEEKGIIWFQQIRVSWGAWSIVEALLILLRETLKNPQITYIHIISGQCWPTKSAEEIYEFYENRNDIFMTYIEASKVFKRRECLTNWMKYYYPYDVINRKSVFGKILHRIIIFGQSILRVNKLKRYHFDLTLFTGSQWMDLPADAVSYLINYFDQHQSVQKIFKTGFCSDEFFCQTILCNSPYKDRIINDNHRFIKWEKRHGSFPAILDEKDYMEIVSGEYHFMRKVDEKISKELLALYK